MADEIQNSDNGFERQTYLPWDTNGTLQVGVFESLVACALQINALPGLTL